MRAGALTPGWRRELGRFWSDRAAALGIGLLVLEDHVRGCVANALRAEDDDAHQDEIMADLMGAIDRFGRSVG